VGHGHQHQQKRTATTTTAAATTAAATTTTTATTTIIIISIMLTNEVEQQAIASRSFVDLEEVSLQIPLMMVNVKEDEK
jgi:hypothetical protein